MFARRYFEKSPGFTPRVAVSPGPGLAMIVVIPCIHEPDILKTLDSLYQCDRPEGNTEVLILVNEPEGASPDLSAFNRATMDALQQWTMTHQQDHLTFFTIGPVVLPRKWAGVGLARKAGMDEALWRFHLSACPGGLIVSLDADTLVETGYLRAIEAHFRAHPAHVGATIRFRHQTGGFPDRQVRGIRLYEQYMFYYKNALDWSGYPHALYTVGSAFTVIAEAYMKRGGMTRRKAGEDFYFLQTLTQLGEVGEIESTTIHPSPRVSGRVPFGTGPVMRKWMEGSDELLYAFNFEAFEDLRLLFQAIPRFFRTTPEETGEVLSALPQPVTEFLMHEQLIDEIRELSHNCSTPAIFGERFFQVFNAFRILRFLNFTHPRHYRKTPLDACCRRLAIRMPGLDFSDFSETQLL